MRMLWVELQKRLPGEADGDENGMVFVWHSIQGAMLCRYDQVMRNRFFTHWGRIAEHAKGNWISTKERMPDKADADVHNCVLVYDRHDGHKVTGWHQVRINRAIEMWQRLPDAPQT